MAFNLGALKALFSKLKPAAKAIAPMTDDIARLGANYGDDIARGIANYGDDVANAIANYGDDALAATDLLDDLPLPMTSQERLKQKLLDKRSPASLDIMELSKGPAVGPGYNSEAVSSALREISDSPFLGGFPQYTNYLGDVVSEVSDGPALVPKINSEGLSVQVPPLPTSQLVAQAPYFGIRPTDGIGLRPHRNTALGRWFAKQVRPDYRFNNADVMSDDYLPF